MMKPIMIIVFMDNKYDLRKFSSQILIVTVVFVKEKKKIIYMQACLLDLTDESLSNRTRTPNEKRN